VPSLGRRAVLAGLAGPLVTGAAAVETDTMTDIVAALVARAAAANAAFMRGDMAEWHRLAGPIAPDFTLMQPFGGPASRGFDADPARLAAMARDFGGGRATLEPVASYATRDLVVLAFVERQTGRVGGLPEQDWSLRVTQVYRRAGAEWELVHRHADPLVRSRGMAATAALARGE
jgi:ketosteroid isomerase-like protein